MSLSFNANDRLVDALHRPLGPQIPEPLHKRLDQMCEAAYEAGETRRPTKAEMVAAILLGSPTEGAEIVELLHQYGKAKVADALLPSDQPAGEVITLERRKSGPHPPRG
jgi:hypothetical protein